MGMKNSGISSAVWLGTTLCALGHGDVAKASEPAALGHLEQGESQREEQGAVGDMHQMSMGLAQFQALAAANEQAGRCVHGIGNLECAGELNYGLSVNLLTLAAYHWGNTNGYSPVIDRNNRIQAVCGCW